MDKTRGPWKAGCYIDRGAMDILEPGMFFPFVDREDGNTYELEIESIDILDDWWGNEVVIAKGTVYPDG